MSVATESTVLEELTRRIVDKVDPEKLILLSSRARGEAREDSDYDILIVAESSEPRWSRTIPAIHSLIEIDESVDMIWWTRVEIEEWSEVRSHLITRAMSEGRVLYEKTPQRPI